MMASLVTVPAHAADISLKKQPALGEDFDAQPRVTGGVAPDVAKRINDVLARTDARGRKAIVDCRSRDRANGFYNRSVDIAMISPGYLSLVSHDDAMCGWVHPNSSALSLVFDLRDGRLVDLAKLLPGLVTSSALSEGLDGGRVGTVTSPKLIDLYLAEMGKDSGRDPDCKRSFTLRDDLTFIAYPAAAEHGVTFEPFGIERVVQACFGSMTLSAADLARYGAPAGFIEALKAASK